MENTILRGRKLHMSQIFMNNGKVVPVTVVELESAKVLNKADNFLGLPVVVKGKSKGKGFTGAIKRWGFAKQGETRGASDKVRAAGSIGAQTPGRVFKGKKMAGHKGNINVTIKGLKIVSFDPESNQIMLSGPIPGARNSEVLLNVLGLEVNEEELTSQESDNNVVVEVPSEETVEEVVAEESSDEPEENQEQVEEQESK